ncbi:hypothetical protein GGS23DRAFT_592493 [Durotheca rogersii]|uniref:uncharacterized protein n=1 Tax=Durotheca rogersii TaxID=419775 RepID=UPI00221F8AF3|nr:uncharacterized protein GGS23DRAFT_592493 [Durotheca rogersii]KAI5867147.1 hypothetical protein GGS23DRAFT_592493 [Durotheca rogersii]
MAKNSTPSVAYLEEADDDGHAIPGIAPKYARSTAASSPSKEQPNTSRSRRDSHRLESRSPSTSDSESDITEPPVPPSKREPKIKMKEEKKRSFVVKPQRPPPRTRKTAPPPTSRISDESSYYGVHPQQTMAPASSRPRAHTRPEPSYSQRPPLSTSAYAHQPPHPHPAQFPPPSYPPPQWAAGGPMGGVPMGMGPPPLPPPMGHALVHQPMPPPGYGEMNHGRDLASRFRRPQSAMGFHQPSRSHEYEPSKEKALARRTSVSRKAAKDPDDRMRMPPPQRPASTRPERLVLRPGPPPPARRKSVGFEDDDLEDEADLYKAVATRREVEYGSGALPSRSRAETFDVGSAYDLGHYELEPASRSRRNSFYNFEDKVRDASRYQEDVSGPNTLLTAESLRRVKNGGSSRSTRSSESRDESEYKQSATTRTTRSGSGDDDITIKLPMGAVIEVGNTKIHCRDGGDINIGRNGTSRGGGSDRATSYDDDRKSRADKSTTRTRASSQAGSYSRTRRMSSRAYAPPAYGPYDDPYDSYYESPRHAPYLGYQSEDLDYSDDEEDD